MMGVWLVATYLSPFSKVMEQSGGIDGLIRTLAEKSRWMVPSASVPTTVLRQTEARASKFSAKRTKGATFLDTADV
jgi:hypothetical protein